MTGKTLEKSVHIYHGGKNYRNPPYRLTVVESNHLPRKANTSEISSPTNTRKALLKSVHLAIERNYCT